MADQDPHAGPRSPRPQSSHDVPPRRDRSRSRSPRRHHDDDDGPLNSDRRTRARGGFRWKENRRDSNGEDGGERRLERGYRNRSPQQDDRSREKDRARKEKRRKIVESALTAKEAQLAEKFGASASEEGKQEKKPQRVAAPVVQAAREPMIIVHVNDRLGTKAAIPCLASDPIKLFKAQVAARIGRQPHEILLKRQGERPFKDQLTLEDYGVSNGVQIDLEIDTGE